MNQTVLMSGAEYFDVVDLNPYSHQIDTIDRALAIAQHKGIADALKQAGVEIIKIDAPANCQDGIFTANWAFCHGDTALMASLPGPRKGEEPYAEKALREMGKRIIKAPYRFSGQGDNLVCGKYLFAGGGYRTDSRMHQILAQTFDFEIISLEALPELDKNNKPVTNALSGWPDSFFYDIDLAIAVLRDDLIGWCPEALTPASQQKIRALPIKKIEVSLEEAQKGLACNLVSTGKTVIMSAHAPKFRAAIETHGLSTLTPETAELAKGGGGIRCTTLTL